MPTPDIAVNQNKTLPLKLQDGSKEKPWEDHFDVSQNYVYDTWQTLIFDFSSQAKETKYSRIVVQFNGEGKSGKRCFVEGSINNITMMKKCLRELELKAFFGFIKSLETTD